MYINNWLDEVENTKDRSRRAKFLNLKLRDIFLFSNSFSTILGKNGYFENLRIVKDACILRTE